MGEIDGPKISVNQVNYGGIQKQTQAADAEAAPQINDLSELQATDTIGRSLLFKGNDSLKNDLRALLENPQIAENSDKMFEISYAAAKSAGMANCYEEAASAATTEM